MRKYFKQFNRVLVVVALSLSFAFCPPALLLAQSDAASPSDASSSAQASGILVPGSSSLLLDPSDTKLPFGHGNQIPLESLELQSQKILVREIDPANNNAQYDYLDVGATEKIYPASMTKLMTALLLLEAIDAGTVSLDQVQHATWEDLNGLFEQDAAVVGLEFGEAMSVRDLLYASLLNSGNDAANVLTHPLADHLIYFVELMNAKAKEMGLTGTRFANAHGLSDQNNYSTLNDMAKILLACLEHPLFVEISGTHTYTTAASDEHPEGIDLTHTIDYYANLLDTEVEYIQGGKSGYVEESNYSLASYHEENGKMYLVVSNDALNAGDNVLDHEKVYAYLFEEQGPYKMLEKGDFIKELDVKGASEGETVSFTVGADLEVMLPPIADLSRFQVELSVPAELKAPLTAGQAVGLLSVKDTVRDLELYREVFTPGINIKQSSLAYFQDTYLGFVAYAFGGIFLIVLILFVIRSFRKKGPQRRGAAAHFDDYEG